MSDGERTVVDVRGKRRAAGRVFDEVAGIPSDADLRTCFIGKISAKRFATVDAWLDESPSFRKNRQGKPDMQPIDSVA